MSQVDPIFAKFLFRYAYKMATFILMNIFGFSKSDFLEGVDIGGAVTFINFPADLDIQLFI